MPNLCNVVEEVVTLLGAITDKWVRRISNDQVKVAVTNISTFFAFEL